MLHLPMPVLPPLSHALLSSLALSQLSLAPPSNKLAAADQKFEPSAAQQEAASAPQHAKRRRNAACRQTAHRAALGAAQHPPCGWRCERGPPGSPRSTCTQRPVQADQAVHDQERQIDVLSHDITVWCCRCSTGAQWWLLTAAEDPVVSARLLLPRHLPLAACCEQQLSKMRKLVVMQPNCLFT